MLAVFTYTPLHDVVEVDQQGYDTCTIANAIATHDTGETVITLDEPGTRYFVCGRLGHCQQGLKLEVQVLAQSSNNGTDDDDNNDNGNDVDAGISPSRGGGRIRPPRRRRSPPPPTPPPRSSLPPFPPSPDIPLPPPADGPCQCHNSHACEDSYGVMALITMVTIISFFSASGFIWRCEGAVCYHHGIIFNKSCICGCDLG